MLAEELHYQADAHDLTIEAFLSVVLEREKILVQRRKIEQEQTWWMNRPLTLRAEYEGYFAAVHLQKVVDFDSDRIALLRRIRTHYGQKPILVIPAEGPAASLC